MARISEGHWRIITLVLVAVILFTSVLPTPAGATPEAPGYVPEQVGNFQEARDICNATAVLGVPNWLTALIAALGVYSCHQALDKLDTQFTEAYLRAEREGASPGYPINDVHMWHSVSIQDFVNGHWGEGAIIRGYDTPFPPEYVGGGAWNAFKRAANGYNVFPGYPINTEHDWGYVRIQDFRGGAWGDGAIIGGGNAELVAGNHWKAYINADGSIRLGNPLTFVNPQDGWWVQHFQGGQIWESSGTAWVYYYDTGSWLRVL